MPRMLYFNYCKITLASFSIFARIQQWCCIGLGIFFVRTVHLFLFLQCWGSNPGSCTMLGKCSSAESYILSPWGFCLFLCLFAWFMSSPGVRTQGLQLIMQKPYHLRQPPTSEPLVFETVQTSLASNSKSSCLSLSNAGVTGVHYHTWLISVLIFSFSFSGTGGW
jgi:hypothetical protein